MANLQTAVPLNFFAITGHLIYGNYLVANSSQLVLRTTDGGLDYFNGSFAIDSFHNVSGIVSSWQEAPAGYANPVYTISGMNLDINHAYAMFQTGHAFDLMAEIFAGNDTIQGSDYSDAMLGFDGNDSISGNGGNDDVNGNQGSDTVWGGAGDDNVRGGKDADYVSGDAGNDTVNGNVGNDLVHGGDGNDWVLGGQNDDILYGDAGNDTLSGDLGNDTLYGGAGADVFLFNVGIGNDVIMDFVPGVDQIWVTAALAATVGNSFAAAVSYVGSDTILTTPAAQVHIVNAHVTEGDVFIV